MTNPRPFIFSPHYLFGDEHQANCSFNYQEQRLFGQPIDVAAANVMCRNTISVGWDGYIYDCDFNQMLELKVDCSNKHILNFDSNELRNRSIVINQHCFGCTAGAGSSCGGAVT